MLSTSKIIGMVPITDAARAKDFYADKLGLKFITDDGFALVFDSNGNMIRLAKMREVKPQQFTVLGWEVSNIEEKVKTLQAAGVSFERFGDIMKQDELGIWTAPNGNKVAWFKDPDGNVLSVSQH